MKWGRVAYRYRSVALLIWFSDRPSLRSSAHAKAAGVNRRLSPLRFVAWRRATSSGVERSRACLAMERKASMRRGCVASVSGQRSPIARILSLAMMLFKAALLSYR
jgi:hypothetical protein